MLPGNQSGFRAAFAGVAMSRVRSYLQHLWQIRSLGLDWICREPEGTAPNLNLAPTPVALKRRIVNYNLAHEKRDERRGQLRGWGINSAGSKAKGWDGGGWKIQYLGLQEVVGRAHSQVALKILGNAYSTLAARSSIVEGYLRVTRDKLLATNPQIQTGFFWSFSETLALSSQ